jgi:sugar phosphate isomerase/epimerase
VRLYRRHFLKSGAAAIAGTLVPTELRASVQPSLPFPTEARARLAVTSYPFRSLIDSPRNRERNHKVPGMDMKAFPLFVAETFGVHNINPLADHFSSTDEAYLEAFRSNLEKAASHIVDLGLSDGSFYSSDAAIRKAAVEAGKQGVDLAARLGSPSVRQHVAGHEKPDVARAAESLGQLAEYGAKQNVVINLENDNLISENPFFLVAVIEKANHPYLRALPDFGNSLLGHDSNYNRGAVKGMLRHAFNMCHVKDIVVDEAGKPFKVDLPALFALAKSTGYRGFFSMEFDSDVGDPIAGTKQLVSETLQYLT